MTEDVSIALRGEKEGRGVQSWGEWRNRYCQQLQKREHESQTLKANEKTKGMNRTEWKVGCGVAGIAAGLRNWRNRK